MHSLAPRFRTLVLFLALAAGGFLAAWPAGAQQGSATLEGSVVNEKGEPIAGARVRLQPRAAGGDAAAGAVTSGAGLWRAARLPAGVYTVRVEAPGYQAAEAERRLAAGEAGRVDVALRAAPLRLEGVEVVSVTRSSLPVAAVPGAVSVVTAREVEAQMAVAQSVGEILGKAVPGLAVGTQSMSNNGQSLRGRGVAVLIDGVPQSTLRNVSRDFANIDPAMIERVEVLRGATALYGDGATGGVINIITRQPGRGEPRLTSEVSSGGSLSRPGEGLGWRLTQGVAGQSGKLSYTLNGALSRTSGFYDAEGDLIPADPHGQGGLADTEGYDLFTRLGYAEGAQRVQLSANYFRSAQDTRFTADPAVNALPPGEAKARALPGLREDERQGTHNAVLSLDYSHADLLRSQLRGQLYYRDYLTRFRGFDRRKFKTVATTLPDGTVKQERVPVSGYVSQSFVDSEKLGGRLEAESRFFGSTGPSLVWGLDYTRENTSQPVGIIDAQLYDSSHGLVFETVGERLWVPPLRPHSLGLFAQLGWQLGDALMVRGGVRRERVRMHVDDFVTLDDHQVRGGDLAYDPTLFNLGAVLSPGSSVSLFANFAQGFSLADIGRILRGAADGFSVGNNSLPAPLVDHYEVGVRGMGSVLESSLSVFYSTSKLGTNLVENENRMLEVSRAPERIRGVEATLDVHPAAALSLGGGVSWAEGEAYSQQAEEYRALNGYRIQPLKLTGYLEHRTLPGWQNRLQLLHSGSRDRAFRDRLDPAKPAGYGEYPVKSFTVLDLSSSLRLGQGTLRLGIENLLNRQYYDIVSQLDLSDGNAYYTAARGAAFTLGYSVTY